jgi:hypothetical protein
MGSVRVMYLEKMSRAASASGRSILILTSRRPQDRRVDHVLPVGRADDDDVLQALYAVDLAQQLRNNRVLHVGGNPRTAGAEDRIHLVEEDDYRRSLACFLPRPLEHQADVTLGLPHVFVE